MSSPPRSSWSCCGRKTHSRHGHLEKSRLTCCSKNLYLHFKTKYVSSLLKLCLLTNDLSKDCVFIGRSTGTLGFQLQDTVLLLGTVLLLHPVHFQKYEACLLIGSTVLNFEAHLGHSNWNQGVPRFSQKFIF